MAWNEREEYIGTVWFEAVKNDLYRRLHNERETYYSDEEIENLAWKLVCDGLYDHPELEWGNIDILALAKI